MTVEELKHFYENEILLAEQIEADAAAHGSDEDLADAVELVQEQKMVVAALDKQIAKVPEIYNGKEWCRCPACSKVVRFGNYCMNCGQKLKERDAND